MSRWLVVPLVLLGLVGPATAQADDAAPAPKLVVDSKDLDFGEVIHGAKARLQVKLKNAGAGPLLLKQVKPSCGCTVAKHPERIAPGEEGTIDLEFDSSERAPGYQSFRVAIYHNDATQNDQGAYCTILNLRGEVRTLFRPLPQGAYFGVVIRGLKPVERTVRVLGLGAAKQGFSLELAEALPDYLQVQIKPWSDGRHRGQEVVVRLLPHAPLGSMQVPIELRTNVKEQPRLRITTAAVVNTRIMGPPAVHFGEVSRAGGESRLVVIERIDDLDGLPLVKSRHDERWLDVGWKSIGPRRLELELTFRPNAPPGPYASEVLLLFDDPHQKTLSIPVHAFVRGRVSAEPSAVLLPATVPAGGVVGTLEVQPPPKAVAIEPAEAGLRARLEQGRVTITCEGPLPRAEARLVLTTDVPGEERVVVPILPR